MTEDGFRVVLMCTLGWMTEDLGRALVITFFFSFFSVFLFRRLLLLLLLWCCSRSHFSDAVCGRLVQSSVCSRKFSGSRGMISGFRLIFLMIEEIVVL